ncbi:MAG: tetratricopeptide repeat protein [Pseudomonadota bacterium]
MNSALKQAAILAGAAAIAVLVPPGAIVDVSAQQAGTEKKSVRFSTIVKRAKSGNAEAQLALGEAYENGRNVPVDFLKAAKWYKRALRQGNIEATFRLARLVHRGGGKLAKSPELAAELYQRAARQGHPSSQNWLGYCNQFGFGVTQDYAKALNWYRKAAEQGDPAAQNNLGMLYLSGKGVSRDFIKAAQHFADAVKKRYPWAENNLGGLYEMGWGVRKNMKRATDLYRAAAASGNEKAKKNLKRLALARAASSAAQEAQQQTSAPGQVTTSNGQVRITIGE